MDLERLLGPVSFDQPSGLELRNDDRFLAIERALEVAARSNRVAQDGTIKPTAPQPDWSRISSDGFALAETGRDLRLLTTLVRAAYAEDGFSGLAAGLGMLSQTLERYWDSLHPEMRDRPEPGMAAMPRANALKQLENDDNGLLGDLRFGVMLNPRGLGPIVGEALSRALFRDFDVLQSAASGLGQAEKDALVSRHAQTSGRVKAAVRAMADTDAPRLAEMITALAACEKTIETLEETFRIQAGLGDGPGLSLGELSSFLRNCKATLAAAQAEAGGTLQAHTEAVSEPLRPAASDAAVAPAAAGMGAPGAINSRADVETALGAIILFYERTEPGSPIPHLARRMQSLVHLNFLDLMEQVAPAGLKEFRALAGIEELTRKSQRRGNDE